MSQHAGHLIIKIFETSSHPSMLAQTSLEEPLGQVNINMDYSAEGLRFPLLSARPASIERAEESEAVGAWARLRRIREEIFALRARIRETRSILKDKQSLQQSAEDRLFQHVIRSYTTEAGCRDAEAEKSTRLIDGCQRARDECRSLEDDCCTLEWRLFDQEENLNHCERQLYNTMSPQASPSVLNCDKHDEHDFCASYLRRIGDLDILTERLYLENLEELEGQPFENGDSQCQGHKAPFDKHVDWYRTMYYDGHHEDVPPDILRLIHGPRVWESEAWVRNEHGNIWTEMTSSRMFKKLVASCRRIKRRGQTVLLVMRALKHHRRGLVGSLFLCFPHGVSAGSAEQSKRLDTFLEPTILAIMLGGVFTGVMYAEKYPGSHILLLFMIFSSLLLLYLTTDVEMCDSDIFIIWSFCIALLLSFLREKLGKFPRTGGLTALAIIISGLLFAIPTAHHLSKDDNSSQHILTVTTLPATCSFLAVAWLVSFHNLGWAQNLEDGRYDTQIVDFTKHIVNNWLIKHFMTRFLESLANQLLEYTNLPVAPSQTSRQVSDIESNIPHQQVRNTGVSGIGHEDLTRESNWYKRATRDVSPISERG
ncbi:hypothetical protein BKA64DRAFT_737304 [Cadophora sp. MPI-SDFR-AT-0126]|nr:hypothetical protein BKA64DRAFT_737304 [Leotiomycetes sp. MPI-SDFR-AT-0126]